VVLLANDEAKTQPGGMRAQLMISKRNDRKDLRNDFVPRVDQTAGAWLD
jgi:hypothetical protein